MKQAKFCVERRKDSNGNLISRSVPIRLIFHFNGLRLEYYTGIRVTNIDNFIKDYFKIGKLPVKANEPESARKNQMLKNIRVQAEQLYDNAIALGENPTTEYIKNKLDEQFKGKSETGEVLVKDAFQQFLRYVKNKYSVNTWKKHYTTYNHLQSVFSREFTKLTFDKIDTAFVHKFKNGLVDQGFMQEEQKKEYLNNTVVKYLDSFRGFLNWCRDDERKYYSGSAKFNDVRENEINVIYLDADEIRVLENTIMPNDKWQQIADIFLFGCYTGLRYSDLYKLRKRDVLIDKIRFYITKGDHTTWHFVPLIDKAKAILKKYSSVAGDKALPLLSNQKMNDYLKDVMKHAGFNQILTIKEKMGNGKLEEREYEKWELISCHTSRKSFISFAVENGMDESVIKSITGHSKNSRAFTRYYEISDEKKKRAMDNVFGKMNMLQAVL